MINIDLYLLVYGIWQKFNACFIPDHWCFYDVKSLQTALLLKCTTQMNWSQLEDSSYHLTSLFSFKFLVKMWTLQMQVVETHLDFFLNQWRSKVEDKEPVSVSSCLPIKAWIPPQTVCFQFNSSRLLHKITLHSFLCLSPSSPLSLTPPAPRSAGESVSYQHVAHVLDK